MSVKKVLILGSTGSIGVNALDVISRFPGLFRVVGLSAFSNVGQLKRQVRRFKPAVAAVATAAATRLKKDFPSLKVFSAESELAGLVQASGADIVVLAVSGSAALIPFLAAVRLGMTVASANKEALVIAGELLMTEARRHGAVIIPIDSEQSAIFQCLEGRDKRELSRVLLTASGGPLRKVPAKDFQKISVERILAHPRWKMGRRITVDSATLMNKGFEIIEAMRLFDLRVDDIEVLVHPEAIIHSMVEFRDGSILAQLAVTDMRLPIQFALTYPKRLVSGLRPLDLAGLGTLGFESPDVKKFPALGLAREVAAKGGTFPSVLNAADEVAVEAFLNRKLPFPGIYRLVEKVVRRHRAAAHSDLLDILAADAWAREEAARCLAA